MMTRLLGSKGFILGMTLLSLWNCAPSVEVQEFPDTASSSEEVQRLATDIKNAEGRQVDVFAPNSFKEAAESLESAIESQKEGDDAKDILHEVAVGRAYIDQANRISEATQSSLSAISSARLAALKAGANLYYPKDLEAADNKLRTITAREDTNRIAQDDETLKELQKNYLDVELKAIKQANLGPARQVIEQAISEGAKDNAEQSLAVAENSVRDAELFITANRYKTDEVKARSEKALFAANYLLKITRASKAAQNITTEEAAIMMERERAKAEEERYKLEAERRASTVVAGTVRDLASEKEFNEQFAEASAEFTKDEAEVYRQGDKLLIRLKTLEFPVNKAVIQSSNFAILGKLGKVISDFKNASVSVEGHTDSTGNASRNKKLSLDRAQAVANYFIASNVIEPSRVSVVGWGSERPLASNKTAAGKAQNRRVDVVISSAMVSH